MKTRDQYRHCFCLSSFSDGKQSFNSLLIINPASNPKCCIRRKDHNTSAFQKGHTVVVCPTPEPTVTNAVPLSIALPPLPSQCTFVITDKDTAIQCSISPSPIPTVSVPLPTNCSATNHANLILCKQNNDQTT